MTPNVVRVPVRKAEIDSVSERDDVLAVEEPLEILLGERNVSITMHTPCNDEELAAGFLFTESIVRDRTQIAGIALTGENQVTVSLAGHAGIDLSRLERHFYMSSGCGVCGKASIQVLETVGCPSLASDRPIVHSDLIHRLPELLRAGQPVFDRTGGLHASALFHSSGRLVDVREDVGRHNALDKLIGPGGDNPRPVLIVRDPLNSVVRAYCRNGHHCPGRRLSTKHRDRS